MSDPGTQMVVKLALTAAQMALTMSQRFEGPRLDNLDVSTADPGTPLIDAYGYVRNDGPPVIHAERLRERKVESKTKGGKFSNYKYYGTWINILAGHPIDAVAKIRWDRKLVYDATARGPISPLLGIFPGSGGSPVKLAQGRNFRIGLGDEGQMPSPRYTAWCEDRYGPDSAPANRGTPIAEFIDVPLEKVGNRIPQVSVDTVRVKTPAYLWDEIDATGGPIFSPDYSRFYMDGAFWDTATLEKIIDAPASPDAWTSNGTYYDLSGNFPVGPTLHLYSIDGQGGAPIATSTAGADGVILSGGSVLLHPYGGVLQKLILLEGLGFSVTDIDFVPGLSLDGADGTAHLIGHGAVPGIHVATVASARAGAGSSVIPTGLSLPVVGWVNANGEWVLIQGNDAYLVDPESLTILQTVTGAFGVTDVSQGSTGYSFWTVSGSTAVEYSMLDLSEIRTVNLLNWGSAGIGGFYDPINHAIFQTRVGNTRILYLDRISTDSVINLSDILTIECGLVNATNQDFSGTDPVIQGWKVTQGTVADRIAPLLEMHDIDPCPHDFGILFKVRGTAADEAIDSEEFVKDGDIRWQAPITQDVELPRTVIFTYLDHTRDTQPNTASIQRAPTVANTSRVKSIDMSTFTSDPDEAQPLTERYFRRQWFGRETPEFGLTMQWAKLEPGDVKQVSLDGETRTVRVTELTRSGGLIRVRCERDDPRIHDKNASVGPILDGRDEEELYISGPTKGIVLDVPYAEDSESSSNVLLHMGAGPYGTSSSWPGAGVYQLDPVENEYAAVASVESSNRAVWGYAIDVLPSFSPSTWDERSEVTVNLKGSLVSRSQADIDLDQTINLAYLGDEAGNGEWFNFANAVMNVDETWTLSSLKRGRRGTEWAIDGHAVGDLFVLYSTLITDTLGVDEIGDTLTYKAQSEGRMLDGAPEIAVPIVARSLKPYSPTALIASRDTVSGDWELSWTRRTRIGGNWTGGTSIPLGETTEEYRVRFFDENGDEVAQYDMSGPEFTYEAADQTADFGGAQTALHWSVCQLGDAVEGFQAEMRVGFPPRVLSIGDYSDGATSVIVALPDDYAAGDILLMAVATPSASNPPVTPTGWHEVDGSPQTGGYYRLSVYRKVAGFDEIPPTIIRASGTGHIAAQMISVTDVLPIGDPIDDSAGGTTTGPSLFSPGVMTDDNNCLVLDFFALRMSSPVNADLADLAMIFSNDGSIAGTGVSACAGVKASAGAVSATTASLGGDADIGAIKIAIRPA